MTLNEIVYSNTGKGRLSRIGSSKRSLHFGSIYGIITHFWFYMCIKNQLQFLMKIIYLFIYPETIFVVLKSHAKSLWSKYQNSFCIDMQLFVPIRLKTLLQIVLDYKVTSAILYSILTYSVPYLNRIFNTNGNYWCIHHHQIR